VSHAGHHGPDRDGGGGAWLFRRPGAASANRDGRPRLYALPFAGGGGASFHGLARHLGAAVDLVPLVAPGRERRLAEPPLRSMEALVDGLERALAPELDLPYALYGHSLGALVAFELARRLTARDAPPVHLFAVACRAPHVASRRAPLHALPDQRFVAELEHLGGLPPALLAQPDLLALFLPALRADFEVYETYRHAPGATLGCPLTAVAAGRDEAVARDDVAAWRDATSGAFTLVDLDGDHFLSDAGAGLAGVVSEALSAASPLETPGD
jgi:surfactin synthase thioesterase subunit